MDRHKLAQIKLSLLESFKDDALELADDTELTAKIIGRETDMYFHLLLKDESNNVKLLKVAISEVKDIAGTVSHSDLVDLQSNHLGIMPEHDQMQVAQQGRFDTVRFRNQAIALMNDVCSVRRTKPED